MVDEFGFRTYGNDAASIFSHVVNYRYIAGRSLILTTDKQLTERGAILHNDDLTAAIVKPTGRR